jgi:integrase
VVVDALAAHLAEFPADPDGLVFTMSGKAITRSAFGHKWRAAVQTAGLPAGTGFHALRHYYASLFDPARGEREDSSGASRSRQRGRDAGHLQLSVA